MKGIRIYSVSDRYIDYLRSDPKLHHVLDSKTKNRLHTRKYLGAVFLKNDFHYFIPFSSPKKSDYMSANDGSMVVRPSIIPIIRMTTTDAQSGTVELKGTLKLSSMIPVPESELVPYDIALEADSSYQQLIRKEWDFIRSNMGLILKHARVLYNQKTKFDSLYSGKQAPAYLASTVDFTYAETKCVEFQRTAAIDK